MNVDDRRFLRRHFPTFATVEGRLGLQPADDAVDGKTLAVRSDGVVFYRPNHSPEDVFVGWLAKGPVLKSSPATRRVCSVDEYEAEYESAVASLSDLLTPVEVAS